MAVQKELDRRARIFEAIDRLRMEEAQRHRGSILVLWPAIELEKLQELEELHEADEEEVAPLPLSLE
ncbi:GM18815 [Drosophila sechellia]|uniref:GM18815 n=1 Tax=Drosophila sechellia TaxID=7238 RepID=B4HX02_DROSE|nr:GM18815 [Drosophila sechellia]